MAQIQLNRDQVIGFRWRAHQLDVVVGSAAGPADVALLDFGVQNTGQDAARWALANRGLQDYDETELLVAWTLRVSPHLYRRSDAAAVAIATAPLSEADAAKRIFDASKPLRVANIAVLDALATVARSERKIVTKPTVKGALSEALSRTLDEPYLRWCNPCKVIHCWESSFRMAALQAGLELQPDTSPPVLQRIPGFRSPLFGQLGDTASGQFDVVRNYLRFYGPARPKEVANFLDAQVKDVAERWPADAVSVSISDGPGGHDLSMLPDDVSAAEGIEKPGEIRLLGPYDGYLQLKDRPLLVADGAQSKDLWRTLGRPGAVALDGEIIGTWRPRSSGKKLTINWQPWVPPTKRQRADVQLQAERLAAVRGQQLSAVVET